MFKLLKLILAASIIAMSGCNTAQKPALSRAEVSLGTLNADAMGTVVFVGLPLPDGTPDVEITVKGPKGWNDDKPYSFEQTVTEGKGINPFTTFLTNVKPISGTYEITLQTGNNVITQSVYLDASKTLDKATINKAIAGGFSVSTDWESVKGAAQYRAVVLQRSGNDYRVVNFVNTLADTTAFDIPYASLIGVPGDDYTLELLSYSYQLSDAQHLPRQLNVSSAHTPVQMPEAATNVSSGSR